jgi:hypothetical protein
MENATPRTVRNKKHEWWRVESGEWRVESGEWMVIMIPSDSTNNK